MNERIRELMAQAGFDPSAIERMGIMPQAEKFAELIVKECLDIVDDEGSHEGGSIRAMKKIKQHFGIE